jgi:hypothetical protein
MLRRISKHITTAPALAAALAFVLAFAESAGAHGHEQAHERVDVKEIVFEHLSDAYQ